MTIKRILKLPDNEELMFHNDYHSLVTIDFAEEELGEVIIQIYFEVVLGYDSKGCFISLCNGIQMVSTHFEPNYARRAFPCFDEPSYKSKFRLSITADTDWEIISNMPISSKTSSNHSTFETTPLMPCYLLHWTLCKHEKISLFLNTTEISFYSPSTSTSENLLIIARDCLKFFNEYFDVEYPLPKLDLISVFSN